MSERSRTHNSLKNMTIGFSSQILNILFNFVSRTIFIKVLGAEFLGINGLFSNILLLLSLVDLGLDSAMIFSLYKPLALNDYPLVNSLVTFYRRVYLYIAAAITLIGLSLVPFLHLLVNIDQPIPHLKLYYIVFLMNSVVSYLFVYKTSVIEADQKNYIIRVYSTLFEFIKIIIQSVLLILTRNYIIYLVLNVVFSLLKNVTLAMRANKLYPYLSEPAKKLDEETKNSILDNVKSMFLYKIGGVLLNNTDNILISIMVGTIWVGYYSNYYLVIAGIASFTSILFTSINSSVGNLIASSGKNSEAELERDNKEQIYRVLTFASFWIYAIGSICLFLLFNDFIFLWLGEGYILSKSVVFAIILNFYLTGIASSTTIFRNTTGLFRQTRYIFLVTAFFNILLSIGLGKYFGLAGILFATILARLITTFWYEPMMLYKIYFKNSVFPYFIKQSLYFLVLFSSIFLFSLWNSTFIVISYMNFLGRAFLFFILLNIIFMIIFRKTSEMKFLLNKMMPLVKRFKKED